MFSAANDTHQLITPNCFISIRIYFPLPLCINAAFVSLFNCFAFISDLATGNAVLSHTTYRYGSQGRWNEVGMPVVPERPPRKRLYPYRYVQQRYQSSRRPWTAR